MLAVPFAIIASTAFVPLDNDSIIKTEIKGQYYRKGSLKNKL